MSEKNEKKIPEEKQEPETQKQEPAKAGEVPVKKTVEQPSKTVDKTVPAKLARPKECVICSKNIQKLWYYRNGKFYCGKGCWKKSKKEKESPEKKK